MLILSLTFDQHATEQYTICSFAFEIYDDFERTFAFQLMFSKILIETYSETI